MYESLSSVPSSLKREDKRGTWEGGREREERGKNKGAAASGQRWKSGHVQYTPGKCLMWLGNRLELPVL